MIDQAAGFRLLRVRAVATEQEIPFAALHLLCAELLDHCAFLSAVHLATLQAAFGLIDEPRPSVGAVAPAVLALLSGIAEVQPVCAVVDDAHWLDEPSTEVLGFVASHSAGRALMIVIAGSPTPRLDPFGQVPAMHRRPIGHGELRGQLRAVVPGPVDDAVAERMLAESGDNLCALVESLQGHTAAELAGGFAIPGPRRVRSCPHEGHCSAVVGHLTPPSRRLLLAAAADPTGDVLLFERMAVELGTDRETLVAAQLVEVGDHVVFACPDLRSVSYHSAAPAERRLIHRMLAENTTGDPTRRLWHLGLAAGTPDDALADDLEAHADLLQPRVGTAARAAFLERAALLTSDPGVRADRALAASAAMYDDGDLPGAQRLLAIVTPESQDAVRAARRTWHRTRIETVLRPGAGSARHLLEAARRLWPLDPDDAREAYVDALLAATFVSGPTDRALLLVTATEARATAGEHRRRPADQLLFGLATRVLDGYARSVAPLRAAVAAFREPSLDLRAARWLGLAGLLAAEVWDSHAWRDLTQRHGATGRNLWRDSPLSQFSQRARSRATGIAELVAAAALHNAAGQYDLAVEAASEAARSEHPGLTGWALIELVEAAVRAGDEQLAERATAQLAQRTTPAGGDWALGVQATAEALIAKDQKAEASYREAVERLGRTGLPDRLARAELLYGEWLRRRNRRIEARAQLRAASGHFGEVGADAFVRRARRELLATGEYTHRRPDRSRRRLTPQETQVVSLARAGLSNAEIAAQLFISPRTVEYHLYKAFPKLGVRSRAELQPLRDLHGQTDSRAGS
ncbi:LuxR family transcriptional regulator [Micromonospora sp. WMMD964]|uniref:LuxR family transcriptional regulator n=1 Tax=Micromonospora sp. WMMD964 TaxID=3016091 RepID=UPI00249CB30C|nr:LuxR family transcriptional regulator [Micromonospora sp. WMMD964]WFF00223.1 LuxR C-terminal-related transcriptional regulator [Micromonospora sp. WMMD964]